MPHTAASTPHLSIGAEAHTEHLTLVALQLHDGRMQVGGALEALQAIKERLPY